MLKRRTDVSLLITDHHIGFFERQPFLEQAAYGVEPLDKHAIENGYIKEPESVLQTIKNLFERFNIKPRTITFIIHDQNLLIRDVKIKVEDLGKKTIDQYLEEQKDKTLHYPFSEPVITHFIREQNETMIRVIALITDGLLLHSYHDVFDRLHAKEVKYEISAIPFFNIYNTTVNQLEDIVMFVNLYKGMFSIQIVENGFPIFNMIEENDGGLEDYGLMVENYVERIANYYKFNLRKGKKAIGKVLIFNLDEDFEDASLQEILVNRLSSFKAQLCSFNVEEKFSKLLPKVCKLPYAVLLGEAYRTQHDIDFQLKRIAKKTVMGHQMMVLSIAIIILILLIYIPFYALSEEQKLQQNRNNILQIQLDLLRAETSQTTNPPLDQMNYNTSYAFLASQKQPFTPYLLDLIGLETTSLFIRSYQVRPQNKQMIVVVQGSSEQELYAFVLDIYEQFGILNQPTDERWMISQPTYRLTTSLSMEVTIYYA